MVLLLDPQSLHDADISHRCPQKDAQTNVAVKNRHWNPFVNTPDMFGIHARINDASNYTVKNLAESVKRCSSDGRVDVPLSALANHQVNNATGKQRSPSNNKRCYPAGQQDNRDAS